MINKYPMLDKLFKTFTETPAEPKITGKCRFYYTLFKARCARGVMSEPDKDCDSIPYYDKDGNYSGSMFPSKYQEHGFCYYHQKKMRGAFDTEPEDFRTPYKTFGN